MITIVNWWGIFFSLSIPIMTLMLGSYCEGRIEAEERNKKRVAQRQL